MSRQRRGFMVFRDRRSDFDREMYAAAESWMRIAIRTYMADFVESPGEKLSIRQIVRELEKRTDLDEARARDLIKLLGIEIS